MKAQGDVFRLVVLRQQNGHIVPGVDDHVLPPVGVEDLGLTQHGRVGKDLDVGEGLKTVLKELFRLDEAHIQVFAVVVDQHFTAADDAQKSKVAAERGGDQTAAGRSGKAGLDALSQRIVVAVLHVRAGQVVGSVQEALAGLVGRRDRVGRGGGKLAELGVLPRPGG